MFYKNRTEEIALIPTRTSKPAEAKKLKDLCNAYWDLHDGKRTLVEHLELFRRSVFDESDLVSDWAVIGTVLKSDFDRGFRIILIECINIDDEAIRKRVRRNVNRLSKKTKEHIWPIMITSAHADIREASLQIVEELSNEIKDTLEFLPIVEIASIYEPNKASKAEFKKLSSKFKRKVENVRFAQEVFPWEEIEDGLLLALDKLIENLPDDMFSIEFRSGCLDCNAEYGQVLFSLNSQDREELWDVGDYDYFDMGSLSEQAAKAFLNVWEKWEAYIETNMLDDPKRPWLHPNAPVGQFARMVRKVARRLPETNSFKRLKLHPDFKLVALEHNDDIEKALKRN